MLTDETIRAHTGRIERDGFTIVEDAIEPGLLDGLAEEVERLHRELGIHPAKNLFEGTSTLRVYNLLVHGPLFENVPVHENVLPIVERVLDKGCLVSSLSSITILPGETAQPIHADDMLIPLPRPHVPLVCNTMWALTDFNEDNGATRVIRGSHQAPTAPELGNCYESEPAVMKRGSVLVFNGSLWHGGGANRTDTPRIGLAMNYCAGWMRQQENQQLGIPVDTARRFSPRLRKLIGYGIYRGLLGHIDKCSPADLLDATGPRRVVGEV